MKTEGLLEVNRGLKTHEATPELAPVMAELGNA